MNPLNNIFKQNVPNWLHTISIFITVLITVAGSIGAACLPPSTVFGNATHTVLVITVAVGIVGGALKLGIASIGGNVNPNNITPDTAKSTLDFTKPTK